MNRILLACIAPACVALVAAAPTSQPAARPFQAAEVTESSSSANGRRASAGVPRASADGTEYPEITATYWWSSAKLGVIGPIIGRLPEEAGVKILSIASDNGSAQRARAMIQKTGINATGYDWMTTQFAGCNFVLLKLTGGRISGICLIDNLDTAGWQGKARTIAKSGVMEEGGFRVGQLSYRMATGGSWTKKVAGYRDAFGGASTPDKVSDHPAAMYVEVDAWDWVMATSCRTKQTYESCVAGKVQLGMTRQEAYLAMRRYDLKRVIDPKNKGNEEWIWTGDDARARTRRTYRDSYGTTVAEEHAITQTKVARATITDGEISAFEWIVGE